MNRQGEVIHIVMAEDDPDDRLLVAEAFEEKHVANSLAFVENGEELLDYLNQRGEYGDSKRFPRPDIILLDLNMPRMDGREALKAIKADPKFRSIPVIVLTTSTAEQDILMSYDLGASSFITKPVTFEGLLDALGAFDKYWVQIVKLPKGSAMRET